jgi:tRNA-specific 2-thiouridylase
MEPQDPIKLTQKALLHLPHHIHEALASAARAEAAGMPESGDGKTVFVGMSGGVDSSVSAYLLKEAGFNVVGVFIKTWQPEGFVCTWKDDRRDAMRVCAALAIPFHTLDLEDEYKRDVADYMIREYEGGRTPNPDIMCNKHVKFGAFFRYAMAQGADFVATGHYAETRDAAMTGRGSMPRTELVMSADENKDQTYFLWAIDGDVLPRVIFPVGSLVKEEVRAIAEHAGLPVFDKKDSQGVCFIGKLDMKEFLKDALKPEPGDVCHIEAPDKKIGTHEGAILYTIGERHGFTVMNEKTDAEPLFIIKKDIQKNILYVGPHERLMKSDNADEAVLSEVNFLPLPKDALLLSKKSQIPEGKVKIRLRHRQPLQDARISPLIDARGGFGIRVRFDEPQQGVASGQSCVFYDGDVCLGGGIIQ